MQINPLEGAGWIRTSGKKPPEPKSSKSFSTTLKESAATENVQKAQDSYVSRAAESRKFNFTGNYNERLEQITRKNEETDWDSMSDVEKVKLFEDRYRAAFKDMRIIASGLYYEYSPKYTKIYDNYLDELYKYFPNEGASANKFNYCDNYKQAYYGDLTDEEVRAAIQEKYKGTGTAEDKVLMLTEYSHCGVNRPGELRILSSIPMQIFRQVEDAQGTSLWGTGMSVSQLPQFLDMYMSYAKGGGQGSGYKPSWTQIVNTIKEDIHSNGDFSLELAEEIRKEMDDFLEDIIGRG